MEVRALKEFDCPTHHLRVGKVADVPKQFALEGIASGSLVANEPERAEPDTAKIEKRTRKPVKTESPTDASD